LHGNLAWRLDAAQAALSRLLGSATVTQLSASMPHLTACLLASLERCTAGSAGQQQDTAVNPRGFCAARPGGGAAPAGGEWDAAAGAELVVLVCSALCAHEVRPCAVRFAHTHMRMLRG
jgi:hypothetical protein